MGRVRSCWLLHPVTAVTTPTRQKARRPQFAKRTPAIAESLATSVRVTSIRLVCMSSSFWCAYFFLTPVIYFTGHASFGELRRLV